MYDIIAQRSFKTVTIPPGLAAQGLLYYDAIGYDSPGVNLPIYVIVQIGDKRFDFEFLSPESTRRFYPSQTSGQPST